MGASFTRWKHKLVRRSPLRLWLNCRQEHLHGGSSAALLDLLERSNAIGWKEREMGYQALGMVDLSPEERKRAGALLSRTLLPSNGQGTFTVRLRRSIATAFLGSLVCTLLTMLWQIVWSLKPTVYFHPSTFGGFLAGPWADLSLIPILMTVVLAPVCYGGRTLLERNRTVLLHCSALTALAQVKDQETLTALNAFLPRSGALRPLALQTLQTFLATLDVSPHTPLSVSCRAALRSISSSQEEAVALAALDVIARAGNAADVGFVERLATHSATASRVRERARSMLPLLNASAEENEADALLPLLAAQSATDRPSHSLSTSPEGSVPVAVESELVSEPLPPLPWERRLRPSSLVRAWLRQRREGYPEASGERLLSLLKNSETLPWADRAVAYQALGTIDLLPAERASAVSQLLPALAPPAQGEAILSRLGSSVLTAGAIGFLIFFTTQPFDDTEEFYPRDQSTAPLSYYIIASLAAFLATPICFLGLSLRDQQRLGRVQQAAAGALAQVGNPECLVALWDHVHRRTPARQIALQALWEILPMIDADWYGRLPTGSGAALIALAELPDEELALVALDALEKAGSGDTVVAVERLARSGESEPVRQRATSILPIVLARREQEGAASTLLRPSMGVSTDQLLKPVYGSAPQEAGNLLRASQALAAGPTETP